MSQLVQPVSSESIFGQLTLLSLVEGDTGAPYKVVSFHSILVAFSEFTEGCPTAWDSSRLIFIVPSFQYLCLDLWKMMVSVSIPKTQASS